MPSDATATPVRWDFSTLPEHIHYAIGIDGGGTHTRARVWHRSGVLLGHGQAGASGLALGIAQAWRHVDQAIAQALHGHQQPDWAPPLPGHCALGLGLAGANNDGWRAQLLAANPGYAQIFLASDADTALQGAHGGRPGALVIAGTGAIALAMGADGQRRTVGGWGFPAGDEGSGAHLGLQAVNLTQRAVDGRHAPTPLTRDLYGALGASPQALLAWCGAARQSDYASLAPKVFAHAAQDAQAEQLLVQAAQHLETLAQVLDPPGALPLAVAGSIAQRLLPRWSPATAQRVVAPQGDAMDGALALCFQ